MSTGSELLDEVKDVVVKTLGLAVQADSLTPHTPLLGSLPEFDSMSVLNVMLALEERFGFTIEDEEVTGEIFETLGTLTAFVALKLK